MDMTQTFIREAAKGGDCAAPVFACAPHAEFLSQSLSDSFRDSLRNCDVLGAACGAARIWGVPRIPRVRGCPAWGVALVHGKHTLCLWDGRTVWAQGARGAKMLPPSHVVILWSFRPCRP